MANEVFICQPVTIAFVLTTFVYLFKIVEYQCSCSEVCLNLSYLLSCIFPIIFYL